MVAIVIDGQKIADSIQSELSEKIQNLLQNPTNRPPGLAVIQVGNHPASSIYVRKKIAACKQVGITSFLHHLPEEATAETLLKTIAELNQSEEVDGILLQAPLPSPLSLQDINQTMDPKKDVDGFHPINLGYLLLGNPQGFTPCTPLGIQTLLTKSGIEISGKHVVILGRSTLVGKPLAALLSQNNPLGNATVTICHSQSKNLKEICLSGDIIVAAIGKPQFLTQDMVKKGGIVIDVGINQIPDPSKKGGVKIVGDADFESLKNHVAAITPVPKGVGPMTIAMLLCNTFKSYIKQL